MMIPLPSRHLQNKLRHLRLKVLIPALLFALAVFFTAKSTYYTTEFYLDGDASSELVLAHHLAETGQILSSDWYYSTELRVLNTQLVYAPLFHIFSDWHMVRFTAALIMQALLVLSFAYLCKQSSLSLGAFFLGAALLISPTSIAYGRIVLYHCYYMPHIIIGFMIVGLYLSSIQKHRQRQLFSYAVRFFLLITISFLSGLGGIRQLVITHAPLCLLPLFLFFRTESDAPVISTVSKKRVYLIPAFCAALFAFVGLVVNIMFLAQQYSFRNNTVITFELIDSNGLSNLFYAILHLFGFQKGSSLSTIAGIASLGSVCIAVYCIFLCLRQLLCSPNSVQEYSASITSLFGISVFLILLAIFIIVGSGFAFYHELYLIPATVWFIPFLCVQYDKSHFSILSFKIADALLVCVLILFIPTIGTNIRFFTPHPDSYILRYEGLLYRNSKLVPQLEKCVQTLSDLGYSLGYSTHWNANTVTEMTNGQIKMIGLELQTDDTSTDSIDTLPSLSLKKWLTLKSYLELKPEKVFLLLTSVENKYYLKMPFEDKGEVIYEDDGNFIIYGFDKPAALYRMIEW